MTRDQILNPGMPSREELAAWNSQGLTLNGKPARIHYAPPDELPRFGQYYPAGRFALVEVIVEGSLRGESAQWCWDAVRKIMAG